MAGGEGFKSIDDIIKFMDSLLKGIQKNIIDKGMDQQIGTLLASVDNPDDEFKGKLVMRYMEQLSNISLQLDYLNHDIVKEGKLQQKLNGTVEMDGEVMPDGLRFEYFKDGAWNYGLLHQDPVTKQSSVLNWKGELEVEHIEQLKSRIRGKA